MNTKLSDKKIQALAPKDKPYRVNDDGGLSCFVTPNGKKHWRFRYQWLRREKMLSMGEFPDTSLALARKKRDDARALLAQNIDPSKDRKNKLVEALANEASTFEAVAEEWFAKRQKAKKKNGEKVMAEATGVRDGRILRYSYKELGSWPIAEIDAPILLAALHKIEAKGAETAHRARSLAGKVLRFAITQGKATRDWSVDLKDSLTEVAEEHRPAITVPKEFGALLRALHAYEGEPATGRGIEARSARVPPAARTAKGLCPEIDLDAAQWEIPAGRMKEKKSHIVPLSHQAVAVLKELKPITGSQEFVFPAIKAGRPISENTMGTALAAMGYQGKQSVHGFRASARTILAEVLEVRPDLIEHQLAHAVKDANGEGYNRTTFLAQRKTMMQQWTNYLDGLREQQGMPTKKPTLVARLRAARGSLPATLRHRPEQAGQLKRQLKEVTSVLEDVADVREAGKVWEVYSLTLAQKSKLKLSKTQAHSVAIKAAAKECRTSERQVRRIVAEWSKL